MINVTSLKAHRTASSVRLKMGRGQVIRGTKGGMHTEIHAATDAQSRPITMLITAGPVIDHSRVAALLRTQSEADSILADQGYNGAEVRDALKAKALKARIHGRKRRKKTCKHRDKDRNCIKIMDGRLGDRRRVANP